MGGFGSGRWLRLQRKGRVEGRNALDVRLLQRQHCLKEGMLFSLEWVNKNGPKSSIVIHVHSESLLTLIYDSFERCTERRERVRRYVALDWVPCNYGGKRPLFVCPNCGRRMMILYSGPREFLCRKCHNLNYTSTSESDLDRLIRKARKVRRILNVAPDLSKPISGKPVGMHWSRFKTLTEQATKMQSAIFGALHDKSVTGMRTRKPPGCLRA